MIFNKDKIRISIQVLVLLILIYLVVFVKLGAFHMRLWDESMFAVNTYEMMHNGKFFANYFDGHPDICNTKPVLTLWAQAVCVKMFGYNELALRLPSAIAASLVILLVFIFLYKNYNPFWAWGSALVLLTSMGFIGFHTARTAEADSLLTLFLLLSNMAFLMFMKSQKKLYILFFFLSLTLAFATKMVAALLFLPSIFVILIVYKQFKSFVLNPYFLTGTLLFLVTNISLMMLRLHENPEYLHDFFIRDAGRMLQVTDGFKGSFTFYIDNLLTLHFATWFAMLILGLVLLFITKQTKERKFMAIVSILATGYFLLISASATKVGWYDMPLYPYLAIIAAYPVFLLLQWFLNNQVTHKYLKASLIILAIYSYPYYIMFRTSQANSLNGFEKMNEASERFLFKKNVEHSNLDGTKVFYTGYHGSLLFYKYKMHEINENIELVTSADFAIHDKVLVSNDSLKSILKKKYSYQVLDAYDNAELVSIESEINSLPGQ